VKQTLEVINQMQADGVIGKYAIGGAVGATLYLEPAATLDVDIFVDLPALEESALLTLGPLYAYLEARGGTVQHEHIIVGGWPIQFLPPSNDLEREAIADAIEATVQGVPTRVMRSEHLVAIALQTGRNKDYARILQFVEQKAIDLDKLGDVLKRHNLTSKWEEFKRRYLGGTSG
jgi:hypothetical protein